jgi:hypothetical protein
MSRINVEKTDLELNICKDIRSKGIVSCIAGKCLCQIKMKVKAEDLM